MTRRYTLQEAALKLKDEGYITAAAYDKLTENCPSDPAHRYSIKTIFFIIGTLFIMFGVISVIAVNWHGIPSMVKILLSLLPTAFLVLMAQNILHKRVTGALKECICTASILLMMCSLALLSQVFHSQNDFTLDLYISAVVCMPLILAAESFPGTIVFITSCMITSLTWYSTDKSALILANTLIIAAVAYVKLYSTDSRAKRIAAELLMVYTLARTVYILYAFIQGLFPILSYQVVFVSSLFILDTVLQEKKGKTYLIGCLGLLQVTLLLLFLCEAPWDTGIRDSEGYIVLALLLLSSYFCTIRTRRYLNPGLQDIGNAALLVAVGLVVFGAAIGDLLFLLLMNGVTVGFSVVCIIVGFRNKSIRSINFGIITAIIYVLVKTFTSDLSFLVKGIGLIICGLVLISVNLIMHKRRSVRLEENT
jgi:hypothetical protein